MFRLIALLGVLGWLAAQPAGVTAEPPKPDELFFPPTAYDVATDQHLIRLCDMNNDGNDDLVIIDRTAEEVSVWLGNPAGTFAFQTTVAAAGRPLALVCADFNNDNNLDVAASLEVINEAQIFLGDGAGNLTALASFPAVPAINSIEHGDWNEDGNEDLVIADSSVGNSKACFYLGAGDGTFTSCSCYVVGDRISTENFVVHDFNGDDHLDVAVATTNGRTVTVLAGDGTCNFTVASTVSASCLAALGGLQGGYLNDDPYLDLVSTNNNSRGYAIFLAVPAKPDSFVVSDLCNLPGWDSPGITAIDDFDGDGINDIAVPDYGVDELIILKGVGDGTFVELDTRYPIPEANNCKSGDFDHDGRADLAVGTYIGGNGQTWVLLGRPNASIASIVDVPNDQGRFVRIRFGASARDAAGSPTPIVQYEAYRRIDPLARSSALPDDTSWPGELRPLSANQDALRLAGWEFTNAVPAHGEMDYSMIAPTLVNSTETDGILWSTFFIRAATGDPLVFFDSAADSGYSIDNLAPMAPANLRWPLDFVLEWDESEAVDFDFFTVYGSFNSEFDTTAEVIAQTIETTVEVSGYQYYHVTARDIAGNESEASSTTATVDVDAPSVPKVFALSAARPNPFRTQTLIGFDVPVATHVRLQIFDVSGRLVRTLVDGLQPEGYHSAALTATNGGFVMSPGVYFARLEAGAFVAQRRLVLLQ